MTRALVRKYREEIGVEPSSGATSAFTIRIVDSLGQVVCLCCVNHIL